VGGVDVPDALSLSDVEAVLWSARDRSAMLFARLVEGVLSFVAEVLFTTVEGGSGRLDLGGRSCTMLR
jgi:hypothetical protein